MLIGTASWPPYGIQNYVKPVHLHEDTQCGRSGAKAHRLGTGVPQTLNRNFSCSAALAPPPNYKFNSLQFFRGRHSRGPGMKHREACRVFVTL